MLLGALGQLRLLRAHSGAVRSDLVQMVSLEPEPSVIIWSRVYITVLVSVDRAPSEYW